ncbi:MAG: ABC transporter ATP-binding protein/permease [Acetatifactor sp.]|nr:ABC transporter ATP-binding protein/permease [Acetatifactor sp.]
MPYLWRYKWNYLIGIIMLIAVDLANVYVPQYTGEIIDGLTIGAFGMAGVKKILLKLLFAGAIIMIGRFGWRFFIIGASRGVEYRIRGDMFEHIETLSSRFYNKHKTGDMMAHFTNDLQAIRMAVGMAVITTFDAIGMTLMVLVKMIVYVDLRLTVLAFLPLILVAIGCYFYGIESKKRQTRRQDAFSHLSDKVQESLAGIRVLKAFVQEEEDFASLEKAGIDCMEKNLSVIKLRTLFGPCLDAITGISLLVTLIAGGKMVLNGQVTIGQFVAFQSYIGMLVWPMIACGDCINSFSQAAAAFGRIKVIFDATADITDSEMPAMAEDAVLTGDITLKNLSFTYPDSETPVLKNIDLHIKSGEMLGILGRTGSGKSTLANLLLRVYDCEEGMILLDDTGIRQIPLKALHKNIAYVPQDNFLFSDTLEENIAFGLEERISEHPELHEQVQQAAKDSCIHDNIMDFPENYGTVVGERGVTLSGGQKQRSSIARALLMDSAVLILDDSLSAVDTDTEEKILKNILRLREGKTTIVIAHRISTLQQADHVAVLTEGELTEYGTHEELLALGGFYAHIYEKQQLEQELTAM